MAFPFGWTRKHKITVDTSKLRRWEAVHNDTFDTHDTDLWYFTDAGNIGMWNITGGVASVSVNNTTGATQNSYLSCLHTLSGDFDLTFDVNYTGGFPGGADDGLLFVLYGVGGTNTWFFWTSRTDADAFVVTCSGYDTNGLAGIGALTASHKVRVRRIGASTTFWVDKGNGWQGGVNQWDAAGFTSASPFTGDVTIALRARALNGSSYSMTIDNFVIKQKVVADSLSDFPVLVTQNHLQAEVFTTAQADGRDIRFTVDDQAQVILPREIEKFGSSDTRIYVKMPELDQTHNEMWVWYGNSNLTNATDPFKAPDEQWWFKDNVTTAYAPNAWTATSNTLAYDSAYNGSNVNAPLSLSISKMASFDAGQDGSIEFDYDMTGTVAHATGNQEIVFQVVAPGYTGAYVRPRFNIKVRLLPAGTITVYKHIVDQNGSIHTASTLSTSSKTGKIKVTRVGSTLRAFYWNNSQWEWDGDTAGTVLATVITTEATEWNYWVTQNSNTRLKFTLSNILKNGATQPTLLGESVWDADFAAVYHLAETGNGTTGEYKDSTDNNLHATGVDISTSNPPARVSTSWGYGQSFTLTTGTPNVVTGIRTPDSDLFVPRYGLTMELIRSESGAQSYTMIFSGQLAGAYVGASAYAIRAYQVDMNGTDNSAYGEKLLPKIAYNTYFHHGVVFDLAQANYLDRVKHYWSGEAEINTEITGTYNIPAQFHDGATLPARKNFIFGSDTTSTINPYQGVLTEIRISKVGRSSDWMNVTYETLMNYSTFASASAARAVYDYSVPYGVQEHIIDTSRRQIFDCVVGVVATVAYDNAIGNPTQANAIHTGASHAVSYWDGSGLRMVSCRTWHGLTDIGPFFIANSLTTPLSYTDETNTTTVSGSQGASTPAAASFDASYGMSYIDGGPHSQVMLGAGTQCNAYFERGAMYDWRGASTAPTDEPTDAARGSISFYGGMTPVLAYVTTGNALKYATSSLGMSYYYANNFYHKATLKATLPNSGDSTPQSSCTVNGNVIVWSEYVSAGHYAIKASQLASDWSGYSTWASLAKWSAEKTLLDGSTDFAKSRDDYRFIGHGQSILSMLLYREGTSLKYKIFNGNLSNVERSGTITTSLPGTNHAFTGGMHYTYARHSEFHVFYLKDNGDSTSDLCEFVVGYDVDGTTDRNVWDWDAEHIDYYEVAETVLISSLSLRTNRLSCDFANRFSLGVLFHDSSNRLCLYKKPFYNYWTTLAGAEGAIQGCLGAPFQNCDFSPKVFGNQVMLTGQFHGMLYMQVINTDTSTPRWDRPQRVSEKICDEHQSTFLTIDTDGYVWLLGRGRSGEPEHSKFLIKKSNLPITSDDFSTDVINDWSDISPSTDPARGYKLFVDDQWGNMYVLWQDEGIIWFRIHHATHGVFNTNNLMLCRTNNDDNLGVWQDDFRYRSRKIIKDSNGHLHLFFGTRDANGTLNVSTSLGRYYLKIAPKDLSGLSLADFQALICPAQAVDCYDAGGTPIGTPVHTYNRLAHQEVISMSTAENNHTSATYGRMALWAANTLYYPGQNIYDLTNRRWMTCLGKPTPTETTLDSFADTSNWTFSSPAAAWSVSGNKLIFFVNGTNYGSNKNATLNIPIPHNKEFIFDVETLDWNTDPTFHTFVKFRIGYLDLQLVQYKTDLTHIYLENLSLYTQAARITLGVNNTLRFKFARYCDCIMVHYWNFTSEQWEWAGSTDGLTTIKYSSEGQNEGLVINTTTYAGTYCHLKISNMKWLDRSGLSGATAPAGFATAHQHELITDNAVVWKNQGLILNGFTRAYDWGGDMLNNQKPIAGFAYNENSQTYVGEVGDAGAYTGFPWVVWDNDGEVWNIYNEDTLTYTPAYGMTNNGFGTVFISAKQYSVRADGYGVWVPTTYSTKDGNTWTLTAPPFTPEQYDTDLGLHWIVSLGSPIGNEASMTFTDGQSQFQYYITIKVFEGGLTATCFRGQFTGLFGGYF